jgi:hypothetical protein
VAAGVTNTSSDNTADVPGSTISNTPDRARRGSWLVGRRTHWLRRHGQRLLRGSSSQNITINSSTLTGYVCQHLSDSGVYVSQSASPGISEATLTLTGTDELVTAA